jgi:bifunctional ADP-heptose synthase (sugar kinase/adenylyltransferase)
MGLVAIERAFEEARRKNVLFVGEAVTDEYIYVEPLYKPSKETIIAVTEKYSEQFVGGVNAAAHHLDGWIKTRVISQWVPVVKTRYVQEGFNNKLFEIYSHHQVSPMSRRYDVNEIDIAIVLDFGHGFINNEARDCLYTAPFLAVNAQSNAGNHGFNPVTKYKRADYVCVDYHEARLAVADQWGSLSWIIEKLSEKMQTEKIIVTAGRDGCYWPGGHLPALEGHPVDTIGAGDCFMAYTAPLIACGLSLPDAALVGTVAASLKTAIVGHRISVKHHDVLRLVRHELSKADTRRSAAM